MPRNPHPSGSPEAEAYLADRRAEYAAARAAAGKPIRVWVPLQGDPEVIAAWRSSRSHAQDRGANVVTLTFEQYVAAIGDLETPCSYCGRPRSEFSVENWTLDHVIPISKGGEHSQANVVPCCKPCNNSKRDRDLDEWRASIERRRELHDQGLKGCRRCDRVLPLDAFHRSNRSPDGRVVWCKICKHSYDAERYVGDRAAQIAAARRWKEKNPDRVKARRDAARATKGQPVVGARQTWREFIDESTA